MSFLSEKALPDSINFGIGEPTYPLPDNLKQRIIDMVKEDSDVYGPVSGLQSFRDFLADRYTNKNLCFETDSNNVLATCGVTEAIFISIMSLANGGEIIYPDPGYVLYEPAIRLCGGVPVALKLDKENQFDINPDLLNSLITDRTKALIINSPSNPTGRVIPKSRLKEIAEICRARSVTIISDEIYEHIIYESSHHSVAEFTDDVIICSGISKLFRLAGWRLGWCVAKSVDNLVKCHQYSVFRAPSISQRIAQAALTQKSELRRMVDFYRDKRDLLLQELKGIPEITFTKPDATFFLYVDFSYYGDDWNLALKFLENGVITVPSTGPGAGFGNGGKGFIRLSYSLKNEEIKEGIRRIKSCLSSTKKP
jgi:aspartate aminotransferase